MKTMTRSSFAPAIRFAPVGTLLTTLMKAWQVARERRALRHVDPHILKDIGLTQEQAAIEASRPIWDLPANR